MATKTNYNSYLPMDLVPVSTPNIIPFIPDQDHRTRPLHHRPLNAAHQLNQRQNHFEWLLAAAIGPDHQDIKSEQDQEEEQTCPICLDPMKSYQGVTSTCQSGCHHMIHSECWRQYMMSVPDQQRSCPMCRNKDTHWPNDELTRIAFLYADPVEDIMEKGPTWWLGLTQQHLNLHYFQEDETQEEFTSRMEESLQEALEQGATDPEPDSDDEDMPSLISDEDYQIGENDEISPVTVHDHFTVLEPLTDEEEEEQDEDAVLENDARLARAREAAQRIEQEFYQDQRRRHRVIEEDLAADMAAEDEIETEFRNSLERQLLQEFELENPPHTHPQQQNMDQMPEAETPPWARWGRPTLTFRPLLAGIDASSEIAVSADELAHTHPQQQNMDQMPEAAQLLFYNALCSNSREADSNNDDASLGATHPDDNIEDLGDLD